MSQSKVSERALILEAENTNTSPERLTELAQSKFYSVRVAVVNNNNTPIEVLEMLLEDNDLNFFDVYDAINDHPSVKPLVEEASDTSTSHERLKTLSESIFWNVREAVAGNSSTPIAILEKLSEDENLHSSHIDDAINNHPSVKSLVEEASDTSTSSERLKALSESIFWKVRKAVAGNSSTPIAILEKLSENRNSDVRRAVHNHQSVKPLVEEASNTSTSSERLKALSESIFWKIREVVAGNSSTPITVLEKLSEDGNSDVHKAVAGNSNAPITVLEKLSKDKRWDVREAVARNSNTSIEVLERLSEDEGYGVCEAVAKNSSTPIAVLEKLSKDKRWDVREAVAENSNTPITILKKLSGDEYPGIREAIAGNNSTPFAILKKLSRDQNSDVRKVVFNHASIKTLVEEANDTGTSSERLKTLSESNFWTVRAAVAENINTPFEVLEILSEDTEETIRIAAQNHPSTRKNIPKLAREAKKLETSPERLNDLAISRFLEIRLAVAKNINAPVIALDILAQDQSDKVRLACVQNPQTSVESLYKLGAEFPRQFLKNITVQLLLLDPKKLHDELPQETRISLAKCSNCPLELLNLLLNTCPTEVASNPSLPIPALQCLASQSDWGINRSINNHPYVQSLIKKARHAKTSLNDLAELAASIFKGVRAAVARNPKTSSDILEKLSQDRSILEIVLSNENCTAEMLERIASDYDYSYGTITQLIASHKNTAIETLERIAECTSYSEYEYDEDEGEEVITWDLAREALAENINTPIEVLRDLMIDDADAISEGAKFHPCWEFINEIESSRVTAARLGELAKSNLWQVREAVAKHAKTPLTTLKELAQDKVKRVQETVKKYIQNLEDVENLTAAPEHLEDLSKSLFVDVRSAVACNINTPIAILERLSKDPDWTVRRSVAENLSTPSIILSELSKDEQNEVRLKVAMNPNTPAENFEKLAKDFTKSPEESDRKEIARNHELPIILLEKLSKDQKSSVREAVAKNRSTPITIITKLLTDKSGSVALAARIALKRLATS